MTAEATHWGDSGSRAPVFTADELMLLADTFAEVSRRVKLIREALEKSGGTATHLVVPTEDADMGKLVAMILGLTLLAHGWCPKGNWFTMDEEEAVRSMEPPGPPPPDFTGGHMPVIWDKRDTYTVPD